MSTSLKFWNNLILIFSVFGSFIFAQNNINTGSLSVILTSPGYIYINSEYITNHSIKNMTLKAGEYKLSIFSTFSRKWNDRGFEKVIKIIPDQHTEVTFDNTRLYYFNSSPYNSSIIQNNKILGKTPAFINSNSFKLSDKITIKKPGYIDKKTFVSPNQYEYFFSLKPESIKKDIKFASTGLENSQTTWFKEGFVFVSVLSSWAAFYFKREADKNYDKYLIEGNSSKMNKYYDRTKRFDTYSDISIAVSLTSLGTYMYFLIFD